MVHRRAYPNLQMFLRKTNTSQKALARRLGIDAAHVSHILAGRRCPSLPLAAKIAQEANIPIHSLLGKAS